MLSHRQGGQGVRGSPVPCLSSGSVIPEEQGKEEAADSGEVHVSQMTLRTIGAVAGDDVLESAKSWSADPARRKSPENKQ